MYDIFGLFRLQAVAVKSVQSSDRASQLTHSLTPRLSLPLCRPSILSLVQDVFVELGSHCSHTQLAGLQGLLLLLLMLGPLIGSSCALAFPQPSWSGAACFSQPDNSRHFQRNSAERTKNISWSVVYSMVSCSIKNTVVEENTGLAWQTIPT